MLAPSPSCLLPLAGVSLVLAALCPSAVGQKRARDLGIAPGVLRPGKLNAITDVPGVRVGQIMLSDGESIRTGVTAVLPHEGSLFMAKTTGGHAAHTVKAIPVDRVVSICRAYGAIRGNR